jgi:retron-type reverse transcriptase
MSIVLGLAGAAPLHARQGRGGAKAAMRLIQAQLPANRFVLRADVKSYYASIDHVLLMDRLAQFIRDRTILNLCGQYLKRTAERYQPRFPR